MAKTTKANRAKSLIDPDDRTDLPEILITKILDVLLKWKHNRTVEQDLNAMENGLLKFGR